MNRRITPPCMSWIAVAMAGLFICASLGAGEPEWVRHLPFTDDAFWGVGSGGTENAAAEGARAEILMQMSSRVKAVVTMESRSEGGRFTAGESVDAFFSGNSLRGAEFVDRWEENGTVWVLMKYCEDCGRGLLKAALVRFETEGNYSGEQLMERAMDPKLSDGLKVARRLEELKLEDYDSDDILVRFRDDRVVINIINFLPYNADLTPGQRSGLERLGETLLAELTGLGYRSIDVVGHANPTGGDEDAELNALSRFRARTMEGFLAEAGLAIDEVSWKGGAEIIGDTSTPEGRGRNRRVEIWVNL